MPSRHEITNEIVGNRQDAVRRKYLKEYYEHTGRNLIQFKNPPPLVVVMFFGAMPKFDNFAK